MPDLCRFPQSQKKPTRPHLLQQGATTPNSATSLGGYFLLNHLTKLRGLSRGSGHKSIEDLREQNILQHPTMTAEEVIVPEIRESKNTQRYHQNQSMAKRTHLCFPGLSGAWDQTDVQCNWCSDLQGASCCDLNAEEGPDPEGMWIIWGVVQPRWLFLSLVRSLLLSTADEKAHLWWEAENMFLVFQPPF